MAALQPSPRNKWWILATFLVLLSFGLIWSQGYQLKTKHLTIEDGLSQSAIHFLLQDKKGFIWVGTKDGLNRYDGYRFTIFQHNASDSGSLSSNYITALFEDSRQNLWVGTKEGGLNLMHRRQETFEYFEGTTTLGGINQIVEDSSGGLWIGAAKGLFHGSKDESENWTFEQVHFDPEFKNLEVQSLLTDRHGNVWMGTTNGVFRFRPDSSPIHIDFSANANSHPALMDDWVTSLFQSRNGTIWLGTVSGLNRYNPDEKSFDHFPHHYQTYRRGWGIVVQIEEDAQGALWLATPDELMIFDPQKETYQSYKHDPLNPTSLSSNAISSLMRDRSNVMWIGTNGHGLNLYDAKADRFHLFRRPKNFKSRISRFSTRALLIDRSGDVWISADVLYRWNRRTGKLTTFETDSKHPEDFGNTGIWSLMQDRQGFLWAAGAEGLFKYDILKNKSIHYKVQSDSTKGLMEKTSYFVLQDEKNQIWCASKNYLSVLNPQTGTFRHFKYRKFPSSRDAALTAICQDLNKNLWLATDNGLVLFNVKEETFRYFRNQPDNDRSLSNNVTLCLQLDFKQPEKYLWLGTAGGGLNRFDLEKETFKHFTTKDGLPNNVVYAALPDDQGHLWLSTNKGLSRFTPASGQFKNFDVSDGLQSNEFNTASYHKSRSGEMFFGGINGFNYFFPDQIQSNPHIPEIVLTNIKIFNEEITPKSGVSWLKQSISYNKQITLSYKLNVITLEFAALDYSATVRNQFAYKLEGFRDEWIPSGTQNQATFTNLPPGRYVFKVKGSNNDGVWNEAGTSLVLLIRPPFWRTWWAYGLIITLILLGLYGARKYELNRMLLKTNLELAEVQSNKLKELNQIKSRFFANISHEFRTPLTLILGQIQKVQDGLPSEEDQRRLTIALRNSKRLLNLINQLLDLSRLDSGSMTLNLEKKNLISFVKNLLFSFEDLAAQKQIRLSFQCPFEVVFMEFDPDKMEKVFVNLFSNALKFTDSGGKIEVICKVHLESLSTGRSPKATFEISVRDSGKGMSTEELEHIFDRFYQAAGSANQDWEGSGIGLALVRELVELHQGVIQVQSKEDVGSTFTIQFALNEIPEQSRTVSKESEEIKPSIQWQKSEELPSQEDSESQKELILLVEDNTDVRTFLKEQLNEFYQVLEAENGKKGLAIALETIPDLVISDVMMPEMNGFAFCEKLKNNQKTSHIPLILLTARAELDSKIEGLKTGADDYLLKPFNGQELLTRVQNLIEGRKKLREQFKEKTVVLPSEVTSRSIDQDFLEKVFETIEARLDDESFAVNSLADSVAMSVSQLNRKLKALVDQPAGQLIRSMRLQRAADLLKQNAGTVAEICYQVGFNDQANFTRAFKKQFGVAPGSFKK